MYKNRSHCKCAAAVSAVADYAVARPLVKDSESSNMHMIKKRLDDIEIQTYAFMVNFDMLSNDLEVKMWQTSADDNLVRDCF